jgi:hypothetical protein
MICACGPTLRTFIDRQIKIVKTLSSERSWSKSWMSRSWSKSWGSGSNTATHSAPPSHAHSSYQTHSYATDSTLAKSTRLDSDAASQLPNFIEMLQGRGTKNKALITSHDVGADDSASMEHIIDGAGDEYRVKPDQQEGIMVHTSYQVRTVREDV